VGVPDAEHHAIVRLGACAGALPYRAEYRPRSAQAEFEQQKRREEAEQYER
jgi:hypothetical protein